MIYDPAEDSFLLAKHVKKYAKGKVLDLGTGSGFLAEVALENTKDVLAADIQEEVVNYVKKKGINAVKSDLFSNIKGKFNLIIFNPPYLPFEDLEDEESRLITTGGESGNEVLSKFLSEAHNFLEKDGKILIVTSSLTPNVDKLAKKYKFKIEILEKMKVFFEELIVYLLQ
ncbi:MAG TPA: HemK2/MTQ2 family protein methyltransferase [Candidatus Nanoarchaeia archaeon]|nr:HemK2/MTQ2 family protein methyltransferase [Candidatus Nanoarchaeia archaeon]